ncbi:hypothetical protein [Alienimonas californiensis]|uniref:Uncharacterized protein n=1 Tax=Alienimonas californiensis TaxID=2527989 RepID=A0A517P958_9PLAN|nr:hypothetical protein [Alienimonas californiensis]QDT15910.1 hypothetical protein CA12_20080 [Alienimonas californiensis]
MTAPLLLSALLLPIAPNVERPGMPRSEVSIVAVGTVRDVFTSGAGTQNVRRVTLLEVEEVERGRDLVPGRFLYLSTFENRMGPVPTTGAGGHAGYKPAGFRLRVWIVGKDGRNEGLYPEWYEVLPPVEKRD